MKARLLRLHSPDADLGQPADSGSFPESLLVQLMIGPDDGRGEESFDVVVCTPKGLGEIVQLDGPTIGRHHLVVEQIDIATIENFVHRYLDGVDEPSWHELATKIGRLGKWEFEDYGLPQ